MLCELTAADKDFILRHFRFDMSAEAIAKAIGRGCTRNQVLGHGQRHSVLPKLVRRGMSPVTVAAHEARSALGGDVLPVPPAMAALAQFDSVIARCCESRRRSGMVLLPDRRAWNNA